MAVRLVQLRWPCMAAPRLNRLMPASEASASAVRCWLLLPPALMMGRPSRGAAVCSEAATACRSDSGTCRGVRWHEGAAEVQRLAGLPRSVLSATKSQRYRPTRRPTWLLLYARRKLPQAALMPARRCPLSPSAPAAARLARRACSCCCAALRALSTAAAVGMAGNWGSGSSAGAGTGQGQDACCSPAGDPTAHLAARRRHRS